MCETCSKKYKTKGGLKRHVKTHTQEQPGNVENDITLEQIHALIQETLKSLSFNKNYTENTRLFFTSMAANEINLQKLHNDISPLYMKLADTSNAENFLSMFYSYIVRNVSVYIQNIPPQVGSLLLKKVGDKIFHHYKTTTHNVTHILSSGDIPPISKDELGGIQYLSGYVVHNFLKKKLKGKKM